MEDTVEEEMCMHVSGASINGFMALNGQDFN